MTEEIRPWTLVKGVMRIDITPVPAPRQVRSDAWRKRPRVLAYRAYCDELRLRLRGFDVPPAIAIVFVLPMPPSWTKRKRKEMAGRPHQQTPDTDNLVKAFLDALCKDGGDAHVHSVLADKRWGHVGRIYIRPAEGGDGVIQYVLQATLQKDPWGAE